MDDTFMQKVEERIVKPTINGLAAEELCYNGFVFFGLMNVDGEPFVIEYNCRMGDPETEVVMPRLQTDLVALFAAMDNGTLIDANITYDNRSCATIMAVSGGYPGDYEKNKVITGLEDASAVTDTLVFQAGTKTSENAVVTSGGRVLAVTAFGNNIKDAVALAHQRLEKIRFEGIYFRGDIGYEFEKK
jgi:phosphoribosylamine--glycine ligase